MKLKLLVENTTVILTTIVMTAALTTLPKSLGQQSQNSFKQSPKALVDEVWQIVEHQYIDPTFNGQDWQAIRKEYLNRSYSSSQDAYKAIREMLQKLNDPFTRFKDPEEFKSMQVSSPEDNTGVGLQIDINEKTKEMEVISQPVRFQLKDTPSGKIGYIRLTQFSANAPREMEKAIKDLENKQVAGYILDLRSNSGGLLLSGVDIARMWINKGTIVSTFDRNGETEREQANERALTDKPLIVIINAATASGAEILTAALQENQRAILIGTKTIGYNTIQSVRPLEDGSGLAVTIAKWRTPKGRDINKSGIVPDVVVNLTSSQQQAMIQNRSFATITDPQYSKAVEKLTQLIEKKKLEPR